MEECQIHEHLQEYIYDVHLELEYINYIYNSETNKLYKDDELSRIKSIILDGL